MELKGKIVQINPVQSGQGRNGPWKKQEFILETQSNYPKKVCLVAWGDKIDDFNISEGEMVNASIDIESREYNGRWYTDVKVCKVEKEGASAPDSFNQAPPPGEEPPLMDGEEDDLPF